MSILFAVAVDSSIVESKNVLCIRILLKYIEHWRNLIYHVKNIKYYQNIIFYTNILCRTYKKLNTKKSIQKLYQVILTVYNVYRIIAVHKKIYKYI